MADVEIQIPPRSAYVGVIRLTVASLARAAGLDEDRVDDLRMAVSEACANAVIDHEATDDPVCVAFTNERGRIVVEVSGPGSSVVPAAGDDPHDRNALSHALLESLVDAYESEPAGAGARTRLTVSL